MKIDIQSMLDTLPIMGKGMGAILIIIGVIMGMIYLINFLTGKSRKNK